MPSVDRQTLLIVGLGLIGGSIARALAGNPEIRVLACGRDDKPLRQAQADGVIEGWSHDVSELAPQADMVLVATPTRTVARIFSMLAECVTRDTIITDAASVKGCVVEDARHFFADSMDRVVPAHPIAGSEKSGYAASFADLYRGRNVILTPEPETSAAALKKVVALWQLQGAQVHLMSASRHDEILAGTSHLPHLLAFDLVNTLTESVSEADRPWQVFDFAAGGFADFSRIASSDATMWRDIFLSNSKATASLLDCYIAHLQRTRDTILAQDGDTLHREFSQAKTVRDDFIASFNARRQRSSQPASGRPSADLSAINPADQSRPLNAVRQLSWRQGSVARGVCYLAASYDTTLCAIQTATEQAEFRVLHGCEDSRAIRDFIQGQIAQGALIAGPDKGRVTVYADSDNPAKEKHLPVNPAVLSALAVLVAGFAQSAGGELSEICVKHGWQEGVALPAAVTILQDCGLLACHREGHDLLLLSAQDCNSSMNGMSVSVLNDVASDVQNDDELLLIILALMWLLFGQRQGTETFQLQIDKNRGKSLLSRLASLKQMGLNAVMSDTASSDISMVGGCVTLSLSWVIDREKAAKERTVVADADNDAWLSLSIMLVTLPWMSGQVENAGCIRGLFPGLLAMLGDLGLDISEQSQ